MPVMVAAVDPVEADRDRADRLAAAELAAAWADDLITAAGVPGFDVTVTVGVTVEVTTIVAAGPTLAAFATAGVESCGIVMAPAAIITAAHSADNALL